MIILAQVVNLNVLLILLLTPTSHKLRSCIAPESSERGSEINMHSLSSSAQYYVYLCICHSHAL